MCANKRKSKGKKASYVIFALVFHPDDAIASSLLYMADLSVTRDNISVEMVG